MLPERFTCRHLGLLVNEYVLISCVSFFFGVDFAQTFLLTAEYRIKNQSKKVYPFVCVTHYLLLGQLDLIELLHVLLVVLLLELSDEAQLLLGAVGVLLSSILLELHCCLRI